MSRYLLDTNHAGTALRGNSQFAQRIASAQTADFFLCRPSIAELWFMVLNSSRIAENTKRLEALLIRLPILEFDATAAIEFGRIRVELRRAGRPIPGIDVMIAAIARKNDLTLLTADRHFGSVQALRVENWRCS